MKAVVQSLLAVFTLATPAFAEVKLPAIFGDHMVLQSGKPLPVWGTASPGESVSVSFAGKIAEAKADAAGKWSLKLDAVSASDKPQEFVVTGAGNKLSFTDVVVGEVWVCSGQSNMVASQRNMVSKEVEAQKQIRFFIASKKTNIDPQTEISGSWTVCQNEGWLDHPYSAVGYFFALKLNQARKVPVGMIQSAWSGTGIGPWITLDAYAASEKFKRRSDDVAAQRAKLPELTAKFEKEILPGWEQKHKQWAENKEAAAKESAADPKKKMPEEPKRPKSPVESSESGTSAIFNAMVNPLVPYAIQGVIWYQGESNAQNAERCDEYAALMPLLINGWRAKWGQADLPFYFVQLPSFITDRPWMLLRNAQFKASSIPNTAMAVTLDLNPTDNLHPPRKEAVGERLALLARKNVYAEEIVESGPVFRAMKVEGNKIRVSFTATGGGLVLGGPPPLYQKKGENPADQKELMGFQLSGADGVWTPAQAEIDGASVLVWSDTLKEPVQVSYAWENYPKANLYNKEGLPAAPFRSDDLPQHLRPNPRMYAE